MDIRSTGAANLQTIDTRSKGFAAKSLAPSVSDGFKRSEVIDNPVIPRNLATSGSTGEAKTEVTESAGKAFLKKNGKDLAWAIGSGGALAGLAIAGAIGFGVFVASTAVAIYLARQ